MYWPWRELLVVNQVQVSAENIEHLEDSEWKLDSYKCSFTLGTEPNIRAWEPQFISKADEVAREPQEEQHAAQGSVLAVSISPERFGSFNLEMGQNQCYHFGVGAPPNSVYFSGWIGGTIWILTHGRLDPTQAGPVRPSQELIRQSSVALEERGKAREAVTAAMEVGAVCSSGEQP